MSNVNDIKITEKQFQILDFVAKKASAGLDPIISGFHNGSRAALVRKGWLKIRSTNIGRLTVSGRAAYLRELGERELVG